MRKRELMQEIRKFEGEKGIRTHDSTTKFSGKHTCIVVTPIKT